MFEALIVALVYHFAQSADGITGTQSITRPIILGPLTGLVCGDLSTGVIMGAELEAIFMGVSAIGGVAATDTRVSTVMSTAFVILSDIPMETGLALAVTVGALINSLSPLQKAWLVAWHPLFVKLANEGDVKKFRAMMWFEVLFTKFIINTLIIFFCVLLGTDAVGAIIAAIPPFVLNGMNAAAGMLVVVGFALTTQCIWTSYTPVYVMLGFVLTKYIGLNTTAVAILGFILAILTFKGSKELRDATSKLSAAGAAVEEGDDFYE